MPNYDAPLMEVFKKVTPTELAARLGIVTSAVTNWERVPARHIPRVAAITGIPGDVLRPDIYPGPDEGIPDARASCGAA